MEQNTFQNIIGEQVARSTSMLASKNAAYNPNDDKLRAFKTAAALKHTTVRSALAGMMVKHTTSVYDMCESDETFSMDTWNEKITDHINYLLLLRAVVEEEAPVNPSEEALAILREKLTSDTPLYNPHILDHNWVAPDLVPSQE